MNLWRFLDDACGQRAGEVAVSEASFTATYRELRARAAALVQALRARGVAPGDRVAVLDGNTHEHLEAYFAAAGLGAVLVPLNWRLHPKEIAAVLRDAAARVLMVGRSFGELAARALAETTPVAACITAGAEWEQLVVTHAGQCTPIAVEASAVAQLYYTSGTTGQPKGVMLTHGNVAAHALGTIAELGLGERDVWGHFAPMFHLADAWAVFAITAAGGRHVLLPRFEAEAALQTIAAERVTMTNLVPTMLHAMLDLLDARPMGWDLGSLRRVLSGGAPIARETVRRILLRFGCDYVQTYGLTETSPYLTMSLLDGDLAALPIEERLVYRAKTGRPCRFVELRVVDDALRPVAADERQVGEIQVRGPTVTPGYWKNPAETAAAFAEGGWLRTGDLAVLDARGFVTIVDRRKDVINTGGEKVYSIEIEGCLHDHPAVAQAAVYGRPDPDWGERVCAAVVLRPGAQATATELIAHCRQRIAGFKVPRTIRILTELPKTGSGKIDKRALRL